MDPRVEEPNDRYNVLFIAIDDLRPELGCYGVDYVQTPHIDRLAAEGVLFLNHFVEVPTCGASRFALLTGRSAVSSGVRGGNEHLYRGKVALDAAELAGAQSLPELFRRSGYHTTLIGKISHTPDGKVYAYDGSGDGRDELPHAWDELATPYGPWQRGWGDFFAYANGAHREDGAGHRDLMEFVAEQDDDLPDGMMAAEAVRRLKEYGESGERFFLGLGFFKPHLPFVATRGDWEAVQDWPVRVPAPYSPTPTAYRTKSGEFRGYTANFNTGDWMSGPDTITTRRAYLACVRYVDRQVGRVLAAVDEAGLADDTIVVLWGDHGWLLGESSMWGKHTPLELALRSPLIIRVPGTRNAGAREAGLAASIDIYPTLMELCRPSFDQVQHPLDGISLAPILDGRAESVQSAVISYWNDATSVRSDGLRLISRGRGDSLRDVEAYRVGPGEDLFENLRAPQARIYAPTPLMQVQENAKPAPRVQ